MLLMSSGTEANSSYMSNVKCEAWKIISRFPGSVPVGAFQFFAVNITTPVDSSCVGMTDCGAMFSFSTIVEHLYYYSTYILQPVIPTQEESV